MSNYDNQIEYKPVVETISEKGKPIETNILKVGSGAFHFEVNIKQGLWLGADTFDSAPASIDFQGNALFSSVTIKNNAGTILIDSNSSTADFVHVLNTKLNTDSQEILKDFDFGATNYAGAVKAGDITWDTATGALTGGSGVVVYRGGIVGAKAGVAKFTLNASTGDATFAGTLSAPTGTIGSISLASNGNIKSGKSSYSDTDAGFWLGDDSGTPKFHIGSSATKYLKYDGTDLEIKGGNFIQGTIQTAETGYRTVIDGNNIKQYSGATQKGFLRPDSFASMVLGSADEIWFTNLAGTPNFKFTSDGHIYFMNSTSKLKWSNDAYFQDITGGVYLYGGALGADSYKVGSTSGYNADGQGFITDVKLTRSGSDIEIYAKYREFDVNGIVKDIGAESDWIYRDSVSIA